ncbi:MAG: YiiD C-terminal domain-containing protein [Bdellovibrionales bacterium]|nr:YiiD C-terminal domain-containing protein [Bdellovibrionales bacterium]
MKKSTFFKLMSYWPPFLGAGIKVKFVADDFKEVIVESKLHFWNQNYVKTQYGGTLFSMTDPFYMLMLLEALGKEYIVWDKSASIRFKKPGKTKVTAHFKLDEDTLNHIRTTLQNQEKMDIEFKVEVKDEASEVIAEVTRLVYIRKK